MTRGPSSTLATLKREVALGGALKMNLFTYYMEYQYAFKKHPVIGPEDGSLTPEDLKALVAFAKPRHIDILGNQQSFGHFGKHPQAPGVRPLPRNGRHPPAGKGGDLPAAGRPLLRGLPLLPFELFNVCCDETAGWARGRRRSWRRRSASAGSTSSTCAASTICSRKSTASG